MCHNGGSGCVYGDQAGGLLHGNSMTHNAQLGLMVSGNARPDIRENSLQHNQQGGVDSDSLEFLAQIKPHNYVFANAESAAPSECVVAWPLHAVFVAMWV
jgi:hypothetical protein